MVDTNSMVSHKLFKFAAPLPYAETLPLKQDSKTAAVIAANPLTAVNGYIAGRSLENLPVKLATSGVSFTMGTFPVELCAVGDSPIGCIRECKEEALDIVTGQKYFKTSTILSGIWTFSFDPANRAGLVEGKSVVADGLGGVKVATTNDPTQMIVGFEKIGPKEYVRVFKSVPLYTPA